MAITGMANLVVKVADLDAQLTGHDVVWGPDVVSGTFETRRIAFVNAPAASAWRPWNSSKRRPMSKEMAS